MRKIGGQELKNAKVDLWEYLVNNEEATPPELFETFQNKGEEKSDIESAIKTLQRLAIITCEAGTDSEKKTIKPKEILGENIGDLPCLGCQALEKCGVGESYSPENCKRLSLWIKGLENEGE